ncbi:MAG: hypothetical protein K0B05_05865 [Bacteroidales bacterium]|nr:hypothetical protein [Bacteroidales bacterium]
MRKLIVAMASVALIGIHNTCEKQPGEPDLMPKSFTLTEEATQAIQSSFQP